LALLVAEVLGVAALDYGFAGDYDYSLITAIVDDETFVAESDTYDDDVGFPRAVPGTAVVTTRTAADLDDEDDRYDVVESHDITTQAAVFRKLPAGRDLLTWNDALLCGLAVLTPAAIFHDFRGSAFGRMKTASTAYDSVARGAVTTGGIWGDNKARFNDDIFGKGTVFVPPSKGQHPQGPPHLVDCQPAQCLQSMQQQTK
jgi:hypothetical protein